MSSTNDPKNSEKTVSKRKKANQSLQRKFPKVQNRTDGSNGRRNGENFAQQTEEALLKSEEKFSKLFNAVPIAVVLVTLADGRQIEVNEAQLRMMGYRRDEVIGHTSFELGYWEDPRDRQKLIERALAGEHLRNVECRFRRKNGESFIGLLSAELIELNGEQGFVTAVMDTSDLRRAEQSVRNLESKLSFHFQQTMFGVIEVDSDFKVREWNPAAEAIFGYTRQEAVGSDARSLVVPEDIKTELTALFKRALEERGGRHSTNRNRTKDGREIICEWFNTPLVTDGKVSGVMSLVRDVTTERTMQSKLAVSEATLCAIFENTDDGIWTVDAGRFGLAIFNSTVAERFHARTGRELRIGMTPEKMFAPEVVEWWKNSYQQVLTTGAFKTDYQVEGTGQIFHLSFNPLVRDGNTFGISVFARDVTKRRQAEQALRASEERYRHLVASSNDWVWEVDKDSRYTYAGPQSLEILGYSPDELIGKTPFELMPPEESERVRQWFQTIAAEHKSFRSLENANLHKNGRTVVLETNGAPIFDAQGNFCGYRGMDRDITSRKQSEEQLRESERRLRLALESGRMYAFEWNPKSDAMLRSEECIAVLGIPDYPLLDTRIQFLNRLDREDREQYIKVLSQLTPERDTYVTEFRKALRGGKVCWIEARGRGVFDSDGNLVRVVGIAADITERKQAEHTLRTLSDYLINAQEEERRRVARDLHDGVSQALAVVAIELTQAKNASREASVIAKLEKLDAKLQAVISDVAHLSHQLHPSTLKHLGLSSAIRSLCEEISQSYGIRIEFKDKSSPQNLSPETALCFYRVAQEALRNVVKHSHCKVARVILGGTLDEITLHISDRGVGFDTESTKTGLGLVSMGERLRLVGGSIVINSSVNSGTRIEAYAPLSQESRQVAA